MIALWLVAGLSPVMGHLLYEAQSDVRSSTLSWAFAPTLWSTLSTNQVSTQTAPDPDDLAVASARSTTMVLTISGPPGDPSGGMTYTTIVQAPSAPQATDIPTGASRTYPGLTSSSMPVPADSETSLPETSIPTTPDIAKRAHEMPRALRAKQHFGNSSMTTLIPTPSIPSSIPVIPPSSSSPSSTTLVQTIEAPPASGPLTSGSTTTDRMPESSVLGITADPSTTTTKTKNKNRVKNRVKNKEKNKNKNEAELTSSLPPDFNTPAPFTTEASSLTTIDSPTSMTTTYSETIFSSLAPISKTWSYSPTTLPSSNQPSSPSTETTFRSTFVGRETPFSYDPTSSHTSSPTGTSSAAPPGVTADKGDLPAIANEPVQGGGGALAERMVDEQPNHEPPGHPPSEQFDRTITTTVTAPCSSLNTLHGPPEIFTFMTVIPSATKGTVQVLSVAQLTTLI